MREVSASEIEREPGDEPTQAMERKDGPGAMERSSVARREQGIERREDFEGITERATAETASSAAAAQAVAPLCGRATTGRNPSRRCSPPTSGPPVVTRPHRQNEWSERDRLGIRNGLGFLGERFFI